MSSSTVRTTIMTNLGAEFPTETFIDMSGAFQDLNDFLSENGVGRTDAWVGVEFIAGEEIPITVAATNEQGKYRETGGVMIHVVDIARLGVADSILTRGELIRNYLRGQRFGTIIIETVTPLSFARGSTLDFDGGFTSGTFMVSYYADLDL